MIQHQHGYSLLELCKNYGTEKQCVHALLHGNGQTDSPALNVVRKVTVP